MAGMALTDRRQSIFPMRLEVILYINYYLWGISNVHEVIRKNPLIVEQVRIHLLFFHNSNSILTFFCTLLWALLFFLQRHLIEI